MISNYGYEDASGVYYITIDTRRCSGCGECVRACTCGVLAMAVDDYDQTVAIVHDDHRRRLRYSCASCKTPKGEGVMMPCVNACKAAAILHSW